MTVNAVRPVSGPHIADGTNRNWSFNFKTFNVAHMALYITDADGLNGVDVFSGFTIDDSGINNDSGGIIVYPVAPVAALPAGKRVVPYRVAPYDQSERIGNQGGFFPETHERALDDLSMQVQQLEEIAHRSLQVQRGDPPTDVPALLSEMNNNVAASAGNAAAAAASAASVAGVVDAAEAAAVAAEASANAAEAAAASVVPHPGFTSDGSVPAEQNFWIDENPLVKIHRFRDRVFVGDAVNYNGRRNSPYGGSSLNTRGASWVEKHGRFSVYDNTGHIALLGVAHVPVGTAPGDSMGMAGSFWIVNEGNGTGGRAVYIEAMAKGSSGGTSGVELQCGNYTAVDPSVINAYSASGQVVSAFYIGAESGHNYQVGDANTNITAPTYACGAVMDISGGSINAVYQKFKTGIVFRDTALYRDIDGFTGNAQAIGLAKGHEIAWAAASNRPKQAKIRSDVTNAAGVDVSVLFKDNVIQLTGESEFPVAQFNHVNNAINYLQVSNSADGGAVTFSTTGSNPSIPINYLSKGPVGEHRFHNDNNLSLRVAGVADAVNYIQTSNAAEGGQPAIRVLGSDANISLNIIGKGTGGVILRQSAGIKVVEVNTNGVGFYGNTPIPRPAMAAASGTATRTTFATSTVTLPQLAERVKALIDDLRAYGLHG